MPDLPDVHTEVVAHTPSKDAPDSTWAAFYRWSAETYADRGAHYHARIALYRAKLYEKNP